MQQVANLEGNYKWKEFYKISQSPEVLTLNSYLKNGSYVSSFARDLSWNNLALFGLATMATLVNQLKQ